MMGDTWRSTVSHMMRQVNALPSQKHSRHVFSHSLNTQHARFLQRISNHPVIHAIIWMQGMREEAIAFYKSLFAAFDKLDQVFRVCVFPPKSNAFASNLPNSCHPQKPYKYRLLEINVTMH